jgi:hypothetical protein
MYKVRYTSRGRGRGPSIIRFHSEAEAREAVRRNREGGGHATYCGPVLVGPGGEDKGRPK